MDCVQVPSEFDDFCECRFLSTWTRIWRSSWTAQAVGPRTLYPSWLCRSVYKFANKEWENGLSPGMSLITVSLCKTIADPVIGCSDFCTFSWYVDQRHVSKLSAEGIVGTLDYVQAFMYQLLKGVAHIHRHGVMHRYEYVYVELPLASAPSAMVIASRPVCECQHTNLDIQWSWIFCRIFRVTILVSCDNIPRDLKPQNLLVDKQKDILKIADLGLGRAFTVPVKSYTHEVSLGRHKTQAESVNHQN